ncbi:hypothetical protein JB92DRAFT_2912647 [Gautieria morchelliformis]|nr:hypothetical protein JB92DRAFT_2912647 [Gautieria morchelliformis]
MDSPERTLPQSMVHGAYSGAGLTWQCPNRALGSHIPVEIYEDIFAWLKPAVNRDTIMRLYRKTLSRLALVCRYFSYYATRQMCHHLDFDGGMTDDSRPRMLTEAWCTGVIQRLQPMESLRLHVKECKVLNWAPFDYNRSHSVGRMAETFSPRLPLALLKFDNLEDLTLARIPISRVLLQSISGLGALRRLVISLCCVDDDSCSGTESIFGIHETPFPALCHLTVVATNPNVNDVFRDAFCDLAGAATLRSLAIADSQWLRCFLPRITPQLISLSGNFSSISMDNFLPFIKEHVALQDLTVYFQEYDTYLDKRTGSIVHELSLGYTYASLYLDPGDLPDLRSFSGPFTLSPQFIHARPVTKLALDCHILELMHILPSLYGLTVFPHIHSTTDDPDRDYLDIHDHHDVWTELKPIGGGIQELAVPINAEATWGPNLGLCFPNLVHLQLELQMATPSDSGEPPNVHLGNLGTILRHFKWLKCLTLAHDLDTPSWSLSPGDQHNYVHSVFQESCPTLKTIVFGPLMVWHLHTPPMGIGECQCELELLSPGMIRQQLRVLAQEKDPQRVRDWKGKIACVVNERRSGLRGIDMERIFKHDHLTPSVQ